MNKQKTLLTSSQNKSLVDALERRKTAKKKIAQAAVEWIHCLDSGEWDAEEIAGEVAEKEEEPRGY